MCPLSGTSLGYPSVSSKTTLRRSSSPSTLLGGLRRDSIEVCRPAHRLVAVYTSNASSSVILPGRRPSDIEVKGKTSSAADE